MSDTQEQSEAEPLSIWYWLSMPAGAVLIMLVTHNVSERAGARAWMIGVAALVGYVLLSGIVWRVGDWLRLVAMPTAFFSRGFLDTLRQRVFWAIGPQVGGLLTPAATPNSPSRGQVKIPQLSARDGWMVTRSPDGSQRERRLL